jgi:hypothetical protein
MDQSNPEWEARLWDLFVELRKETIETQKIRAQIIGFKITFISAAVGLILANNNRIPQTLLIIPAFAAVFFDFLIHSCSFSIKRIGRYCRENLDPVVFAGSSASSFSSWEQFLSRPQNMQSYSLIGNLGITVLAVIPAVVGLSSSYSWRRSFPLLILLTCLLAVDLRFFLNIRWYGRQEEDRESAIRTATNIS